MILATLGYGMPLKCGGESVPHGKFIPLALDAEKRRSKEYLFSSFAVRSGSLGTLLLSTGLRLFGLFSFGLSKRSGHSILVPL